MGSDITRRTFDPNKRYAGVVKQQGRVTLDADDNEALAISLEEERLNNLHTIGPSGTPDDGFRISNAGEGVDEDAVPNERIDFTISGGTVYVGGLRYDSEEQNFQDQSGWHEHHTESWPTIPSADDTRIDLVYLLLWQQDVTASEDQELIEPALVDIDTSTRVRTMGQICVMATDAEDCESAWAEVGTEWGLTTSEERATFRETAEITTDARLRVSFNCIEIDQEGDLCADHAREGYLYADNQAIRVQIHDTDTLLWGFDNASGLYRISLSGTTVTFETLPRDEEHYPRVGQVVEVLRWTDELPNDGKIAALTGHLSTVASPSYDSETKTFELDDPCPSEWEDDEVLYLRVWEEQLPLVSDTEVALGTTGVCITLSGNQFREGDHWTIGVRPETPQEVYPKSLMDEEGEPPDCIRRFACPLALLHWSGATATIDSSCLEPFNNLVELTRVRQGTCCRVTVGDGVTSVGMYDDIQTAVNELPDTGGEVCILPGSYILYQPVIVNGDKITIIGCGERAHIAVLGGASAFVISGKYNVLEDLWIFAKTPWPGVIHLDNASKCVIRNNYIQNPSNEQVRLAAVGIGGEVRSSEYVPADPMEENLVITNNRFVFRGRKGTHAISIKCHKGLISENSCHGSGIQLRGGATEIVVHGNDIVHARENGITLGSIDEEGNEEGGLSDITIVRNSIKGAGRNGISVAEFFNLDSDNPQIITANELHIVENEITECVSDLDLIMEQSLLEHAAFGGIALADGEHIIISGNKIENNGVGQDAPVCGIFLLRGEGVLIAENVVLGNGDLAPNLAFSMTGYFGGVILAFATSSVVGIGRVGGEDQYSSDGFPAAKIVDNVVSAPWGHALFIQAIGSVFVSGNSFRSLGRLVNQSVPAKLGGVVLIINLGKSQLVDYYLDIISKERSVAFREFDGPTTVDALIDALGISALDSDLGGENLLDNNGQVSFVGNQVSMASRPAGGGLSGVVELWSERTRSAVLIFSLDSICFDGNQLSCADVRYPIFANSCLLASTITATSNTFKEGEWTTVLDHDWFGGGLYSLWSWAAMNIAANNIAKNLLFVQGIETRAQGNLSLFQDLFSA